ncbi:conserved protein, unknown function [Hepatocystis sp. ex Piliocolobus tephrosceles]|nr:conserved protein, unknown function [Hepatocystis sp. ex Piliocolobus tephrosceles]
MTPAHFNIKTYVRIRNYNLVKTVQYFLNNYPTIHCQKLTTSKANLQNVYGSGKNVNIEHNSWNESDYDQSELAKKWEELTNNWGELDNGQAEVTKKWENLNNNQNKLHNNNFKSTKKWNELAKNDDKLCTKKNIINMDNKLLSFNDTIILRKELKSNKIFSVYTKSYIHKENEQILITCIRKLNEYERIKNNIKLSMFIYELQNLSKSKVSFNVLQQISIIKKLLEHINNNIGSVSSAFLLLSVAISYKNIKLNKYTYFKNVLSSICNNIKVYKSNKLNRLLKNKNENEDNYKYTIELLNKKKNKKNKINMLNIYTNHLNNSTLCYILYSYSCLFNTKNAYILYICKYILLNIGTINYLDMLSLLYFLSKINGKLNKHDVQYFYDNTDMFRLNDKNKSYSPEKEKKMEHNITNSLQQQQQKHMSQHDHDKKMDSKKMDGEKIVINNVSSLKKLSSNNKYDEYKNAYLKILRSIIYFINKKKIINYENTNVLILILYYYVKMNLIPIQIFYKLNYKIKKNIKKIKVDTKYISLYVYILSRIKFDISYYKYVYKHLNNIFKNRIKNFDVLSVSLSFYSLSKNLYYDPDFVQTCIELFKMYVTKCEQKIKIKQKIETAIMSVWHRVYTYIAYGENLNDVNITNIIYTTGKLKIRDDELFNKLCYILTKRIGNMSALNLSLIVHNLSKVQYKNNDFYNLCLKKGQELLTSFTAKQLIIFLQGLIINNIYDYNFIEQLFHQLIYIDNKDKSNSNSNSNSNRDNNKYKTILSSICFSIALERQDYIKLLPLSIRTYISKNLNFCQNKKYNFIHDELTNILNFLNVEHYEILKEKKPYAFDLFIKDNSNIFFVDIVSKKKKILTTCSGNNNINLLNGFMALKKRHMDKLNVKYYYIDKDSYLALESIDKKINFIKTFLEKTCFYNLKCTKQHETSSEKVKKQIKNMIIFNKSSTHMSGTCEGEHNTQSDNKKHILIKENNKNNLIKGRNFYLLPTYSKFENVIKKSLKKKKEQVNYVQPLIKKQQIFIDYEQGILLNQNKTISFNKPLYEENNSNQIKQQKQNCQTNTQSLKNCFLFNKKCHGLSKYEFYDEHTGKIVIKKKKNDIFI